MTWTYTKAGTVKTLTPDVRRTALASPTAQARPNPNAATHTSTQAPSANSRQRSVTTDQSGWKSRKIIAGCGQGWPVSRRPPLLEPDQTLTSSGSEPGPTPYVVRWYFCNPGPSHFVQPATIRWCVAL